MTTDHRTPTGRTHTQDVPGLGTLSIRPLDPVDDADTVHAWVNQERARFWGMVGHSRDQVREIYAYVDSLTTHHAYLALHDGTPVALFQTYQPEHDPLGAHYPVRPGDLGIHLLVAPAHGPAHSGHTGVLVGFFLDFVLSDPAVRRIVAEPDARNEKSIARLLRSGFTLGPQVDLADKRAQLVFLHREKAELVRRSITTAGGRA